MGRVCEEGQNGTGKRRMKNQGSVLWIERKQPSTSEITERVKSYQKKATGLGGFFVWWDRNQCHKKPKRKKKERQPYPSALLRPEDIRERPSTVT